MTQRKKNVEALWGLDKLGTSYRGISTDCAAHFFAEAAQSGRSGSAWRFSQHGALRPADLSLTEPCSVLVAIMFVWTGSCLITQLVGRTVDMLATAT